MWTYVEIDGKLYVTKEDYLNTVKYYENSLSAERNSAKEEIAELEEENKKLKETIKDHQFYEEKLEHRIIEFEELLHWE